MLYEPINLLRAKKERNTSNIDFHVLCTDWNSLTNSPSPTHTRKFEIILYTELHMLSSWVNLSRSQVCVCVCVLICISLRVTLHISVLLWHMGWKPQQGYWAGVIQSLCLRALAGCHATLPTTERVTSKKVWEPLNIQPAIIKLQLQGHVLIDCKNHQFIYLQT